MSFSSGVELATYSLSVATLRDISRAVDKEKVASILASCSIDEVDEALIDGVAAVAATIDYTAISGLTHCGVSAAA